MAQPFSVRAALCTAAVMFFFGALATGDLPVWMLEWAPMERRGGPEHARWQPALPGSRRDQAASPSGVTSATLAAQDPEPPPVRYPELPSTAAAAESFAPSDWQVETQARGDLNADGRPDLAMILLARGISPADPPPERQAAIGAPRILVVAFARTDGSYERVLADQTFLPRLRGPNGLSEGWMLFEDGSLEAREGRLRVTLQYTRAQTTFTFRWQDSAFRLIGYDSGGVSGGCFHGVSINFLTRRARLAAGWIDREEEQERWRNLSSGPPLVLGEIGESEDFDPYDLRMNFPLTCQESR